MEPTNGNSNIKPQAWAPWPIKPSVITGRAVHHYQTFQPIDRRSSDQAQANATGLVAGNTYYYRIKGANSASDWADATELLSLSQPFLSLQVLSLSIQMGLLRDGHLPMAEVEQGRLLAPPILTASQTVFHIKRLNLTIA